MANLAGYLAHVQLLSLIDHQDQLIFESKAVRDELRQAVKVDKQRIANAQESRDAAQARIHELERLRRTHSSELSTLEARIARAAAMENVVNQKQYEKAQQEVATLEEMKGVQEEAILTAMLELDELRPRLALAELELESAQAHLKTHRTERKVHFDEAGSVLNAAGVERAMLLAELDALDSSTLRTYESLMRRHGDRACTVSVLERCLPCHLSLVPQHILEVRTGKALHNCASCGRYILPPPPAGVATGVES